jgi:RimJ/RimL family protein N-acetyltransferase
LNFLQGFDRSIFQDTFRNLLDNKELLPKMSAACAAIVDGDGINLISELIIADESKKQFGNIEIRNVLDEDKEDLWFWRNDPETRFNSKSSDPLLWEHHEAWFKTLAISATRICFIGESDKLKVGMVRFDYFTKNTWEVSININPNYRGRGGGFLLLKNACKAFFRNHENCILCATVLQRNIASQKIFERLGFEKIGQTGSNYLYFCNSFSPSAN